MIFIFVAIHDNEIINIFLIYQVKTYSVLFYRSFIIVLHFHMFITRDCNN